MYWNFTYFNVWHFRWHRGSYSVSKCYVVILCYQVYRITLYLSWIMIKLITTQNQWSTGAGADPGFFKRGGAQLRTDRTSTSEGDVPPQKRRKFVIFKANLHNLVHSFCLRLPHKVRHPISAKNRGGTCQVRPPSKSAPALVHIVTVAWSSYYCMT